MQKIEALQRYQWTNKCLTSTPHCTHKTCLRTAEAIAKHHRLSTAIVFRRDDSSVLSLRQLDQHKIWNDSKQKCPLLFHRRNKVCETRQARYSYRILVGESFKKWWKLRRKMEGYIKMVRRKTERYCTVYTIAFCYQIICYEFVR
jgi:hypothetical protein